MVLTELVSVLHTALRRQVARASWVQVAAGPAHVVMLTKQGDVYAWGAGGQGRLGTGHTLDALRPQQLHTLQEHPVKHLAATGECPASGTGRSLA